MECSGERVSQRGNGHMCPGGVAGLGGLLLSAWSVMASHLTLNLGSHFSFFSDCSPLRSCPASLKPPPYHPEILFLLQASFRRLTAFTLSKFLFLPSKEIPLFSLIPWSGVAPTPSISKVDLQEVLPSSLYSCPRQGSDSYLGCARMAVLSGTNCNTNILIWNLESIQFHRSPQSCPSLLPAYLGHSLVCLPYLDPGPGCAISTLHIVCALLKSLK